MSNEIQVTANPGLTIYAMVRSTAGLVFFAGASETYGSSGRDADDYDIPLTDKGGGMYVGDFPSLSEGVYTVTAHEQLGAAPDDDDIYLGSDRMFWHGAGEYEDMVIRKAAYLRANKTTQNLTDKIMTVFDTDGSTPIITETETDNEDGTVTVEAVLV